MAQYLDTYSSLETLLPGYSFTGSGGSIATLAIDMAESKINSYISKRYDVSSLSLTSVPPLLRDLTRQLASGHVLEFQSRGGKESRERGKSLREAAMECLEMLQDGETDLLDENGAVIDDKTNSVFRVLSSTSDYSDTFAEDDSKSWKVDTDKLDDISSERD